MSGTEELLYKFRTSSANTWPKISSDLQHVLTEMILCQEINVADEHASSHYFGPLRFPGTTSIGERQRNPEIFQDTTESDYQTYPDWVYQSIGKILRKMDAKKLLPGDIRLTDEYTLATAQKIERVLAFETHNGVQLCDAIPQQLYEDILIRIVMLLINEKLSSENTHFYQEFNAICHRISLALLDRMELDNILGLESHKIAKVIQLSVLSGYVGINLKSSASAASTLLNRNFIPLKEHWIENIDTANNVSISEINSVVENLISLSEKPEGQFGLESLGKYSEEVIKATLPILLVFFCDDYMESIVDMKRFEVMLDANRHLTVLFIPRSGRYGNDLAYEDTEFILQERQFNSLQQHLASGRFFVSRHGPRSGCIDQRYIGRELINEIDTLGQGKQVILETKGCRNFEMLQGNLQVPWYAGFNCNRALSIRTVGIDGPPVFLRIPPGLKAYDRFTEPKVGASPSYQTAQVRFARMTTKDLYEALDSKLYHAILDLSNNELQTNRALTQLAENLQMTFAELITFLSTQSLIN